MKTTRNMVYFILLLFSFSFSEKSIIYWDFSPEIKEEGYNKTKIVGDVCFAEAEKKLQQLLPFQEV